jgi:hypothetical protein
VLSPSGSFFEVSEMPETYPWSFSTGHSTALLGPPNVPRSVTLLFCQSAACMIVLPDRKEVPIGQPRSLIEFAELFDPPNDGRTATVYPLPEPAAKNA